MVCPAYLETVNVVAETVNVCAFFTPQLDMSFYHVFLIQPVVDSQRCGDMEMSTHWGCCECSRGIVSDRDDGTKTLDSW